MAERPIGQAHVIAKHALLHAAKFGLYYAQAVSRSPIAHSRGFAIGGEFKSCPTTATLKDAA
jgi:hypothetical protein